MPKHHKDPSKTGLSSSGVEGQGTTVVETGKKKRDSGRMERDKLL